MPKASDSSFFKMENVGTDQTQFWVYHAVDLFEFFILEPKLNYKRTEAEEIDENTTSTEQFKVCV